MVALSVENVSLTGELCKTEIEEVFQACHTMDATYSNCSPEKEIENQVVIAYSKNEECNRSKAFQFKNERENTTRRL